MAVLEIFADGRIGTFIEYFEPPYSVLNTVCLIEIKKRVGLRFRFMLNVLVFLAQSDATISLAISNKFTSRTRVSKLKFSPQLVTTLFLRIMAIASHYS